MFISSKLKNNLKPYNKFYYFFMLSGEYIGVVTLSMYYLPLVFKNQNPSVSYPNILQSSLDFLINIPLSFKKVNHSCDKLKTIFQSASLVFYSSYKSAFSSLS